MVDERETPAEAALRELEEETGMTSSNLILLTSGTLMPSRFSNCLTWYVALDVAKGSTPRASEAEPFLMTPADVICHGDNLGADHILALGVISLARVKFPDVVPATGQDFLTFSVGLYRNHKKLEKCLVNFKGE